MLARLFLLFIVVPLIELTLLIWLGNVTSVWVSIGLVLLTGTVGASLARRQGAMAWRRLQDDVAAGKMPTDAAVDGICILIAGALLLTPGLLTDAAGILLLIPAGRALIRRRMAVYLRDHVTVRAFGSGFQRGGGIGGGSPDSSDDVIDVESRPVSSDRS